jgi:hypothetical protein
VTCRLLPVRSRRMKRLGLRRDGTAIFVRMEAVFRGAGSYFRRLWAAEVTSAAAEESVCIRMELSDIMTLKIRRAKLHQAHISFTFSLPPFPCGTFSGKC